MRQDEGPAGAGEEGDHAWREAAARRFVAPAAIAVVGIAIVVATDDTARIIGWAVVALAVLVAVSLVFLEIGYGEERARAREERARRGRTGPGP